MPNRLKRAAEKVGEFVTVTVATLRPYDKVGVHRSIVLRVVTDAFSDPTDPQRLNAAVAQVEKLVVDHGGEMCANETGQWLRMARQLDRCATDRQPLPYLPMPSFLTDNGRAPSPS